MHPNIIDLDSHDIGRWIQPHGHPVPTPHGHRERRLLARSGDGPVPAPPGADVRGAP